MSVLVQKAVVTPSPDPSALWLELGQVLGLVSKLAPGLVLVLEAPLDGLKTDLYSYEVAGPHGPETQII